MRPLVPAEPGTPHGNPTHARCPEEQLLRSALLPSALGDPNDFLGFCDRERQLREIHGSGLLTIVRHEDKDMTVI
jgi:hypothetical protein